MDTNVNQPVFEYDPEEHVFEVPDEYSWALEFNFLKEMFWGGYFDGDAIHIYKFLRDDLSLNLEKLELAVYNAVDYLQGVVPFDDPITLYIQGLPQYYQLRGISELPKNKKEEYYVIRGIVHAVANQESVKPIKVEYVSDTADPTAGG